MTKLEDKLIASVNKPKPAQAEKTSKTQKPPSKPAASTKKQTRAKTESKAKQKAAKKQPRPGLNTSPSILHPQRIWPD